ncbi:MAG: magnesium transporter [Patescibacteria group bacterium]
MPHGATMSHIETLPKHERGEFVLQLSPRTQKNILARLKPKVVAEMLSYLDSDHAADILQNVELAAQRRLILKRLSADKQSKISFLLQFNPDSAAGIMDVDYITVSPSSTFGDIATAMDRHESRTGKIPTIIVVKNGKLLGELPPHALALHDKNTHAKNFVKPLPTLHYKKEPHEVVRLFTKVPHGKLIVTDDDEKIIGIIYADDVLRMIKRRSSKSLYQFAGLKDEEDVFDPVSIKVKHRYKWLIINLATGFLAAGVVSIFEDTISKFVLLAMYMPIVAGMGGNAATQTLAVIIRGIAIGEIALKNSFRAIIHEVGAGFVNGVINGLIVAAVAIFWNKNPMLGVVIGVAMVVNLVIAGFFGALIPLLMQKFGKDPATSATIFITTATDVFGFFVFLGLASVLLV